MRGFSSTRQFEENLRHFVLTRPPLFTKLRLKLRTKVLRRDAITFAETVGAVDLVCGVEGRRR